MILFYVLTNYPYHQDQNIITFTFNHLADAFIQSDVQMRRIEAIRPSREQQYTSAMTSLSKSSTVHLSVNITQTIYTTKTVKDLGANVKV